MFSAIENTGLVIGIHTQVPVPMTILFHRKRGSFLGPF